MIRTEPEYQAAVKRIGNDRLCHQKQREAFEGAGLTPDEVEYTMQATLSFHKQLEEEVEWYDLSRRGKLEISQLSEIGRLLIGMRIARGWRQKQLADALEVSESQVCRDEKNEYHSVTVTRAQRILECLRLRSVRLTVTIDP